MQWAHYHSLTLWESEMTISEQKVLIRGVAAGTIMGLAIGLMTALLIAIRPELFRALIH
jgi:tetrahydromethanopterin S-methyltransferase subunit F